ncbi:aromatic amino acid DMT transporter YddG [Acinetobacter sp. ANC 4178]|uniref:aromatic amino acid DMT transporter YddG n=1 Tax=Acinetobacter sp. ANC 4178 TaxID=2529839 RepID=UPI00103BA33C|nr:aromatic amino acid DMT transporter YddG [Acinetobacter sp. ANC 4178]TCB66855.1 drug/metabolite DMT transporter permease [Acinetobacter sp. ANC 4178]
MSHRFATTIGLCALLFWASIVGLLRQVTDGFGPILGVCLIYSLSSILLLIVFKPPKLHLFPKAYLIFGSILFVAYELCLSLSLAFAQNNQQAVEVSILNYLWPSLTVLLLILTKEQKFHPWVIVGMLLTLFGIIQVQVGSGEFSLNQLIQNIAVNPISYALAFIGAFIWAAYCTLTKKIGNGQNAIALFFCLTSVVLWLKYLWVGDFQVPELQLQSFVYLVVSAAAFGLGYAAWNIGILHGNIQLLTAASYFTPIISSLIAMQLLDLELSWSFWQGAALVTLGSFLCWWSTRTRS